MPSQLYQALAAPKQQSQDPFELFKAMHPNLDPTIAKIAFSNLNSHGSPTPTPAPAQPAQDPYQNTARVLTSGK